MTPGVLELVENAAHLFGHGDTAHSGDHDHEGSTDEHGCTGTYHACSCHASPHFMGVDRLHLSKPALTDGTALLAGLAPIDSGVVLGIDRPPQV